MHLQRCYWFQISATTEFFYTFVMEGQAALGIGDGRSEDHRQEVILIGSLHRHQFAVGSGHRFADCTL